ncbi:iron-siderophore ABC transporter substrate-binding protein [uncultured Friedmanniella sp.]|uniref:iron-siderophore ABC transporter substrate-binding protein n=1 Tax=uncultured Friedmanniella sp. TaxID=335381 RepID=UPI0035CB0490
MTLTRRHLLATAAVAAIGLPLAACSTGPSNTAAPAAPAASAAYPVTVTHAFGETTITAPPTRVATVSWVNADVALALGVVPVGMPKDEYGGNAAGSTPWKDTALAAAGAAIGTGRAPAQYSEADGVNDNAIAAATPDLILAAYSGLTREEYDKLSKIAPVVAYPKVAYGTPWQESTALIGKALGRDAEATDLIARTEKTIADKAAQYPQLKGKTFIYGNLEPAKGGVNVYTANDNRPRFLTSIGMTQAPVVAANTKDEAFFFPWSAERADELESDVFATWVPDSKTAGQIISDPLLGQIPAVRRGALVADSDNTLTLAISASSPLSLPWALDTFLPQLAAAADKVS